MGSYSYLLLPPMAWLVAGVCKFLINSVRFRGQALSHVGLGGFPSNHTTIVSSVFFLVLLKEGLDSPLVAVSLAVMMIVIIDATDLRRKVGSQAAMINRLTSSESEKLREKIGHSFFEVLGGLGLGFLLALTVYAL